MFQVPEWGNDVPNTGVNFAKSAHNKKAKHVSGAQTSSSLSPVKPQLIGNSQKHQPAKKSTDKRKLKKIRQKNRELYQRLSKPENIKAEECLTASQPAFQPASQPASEPDSQPGRFVLYPNKIHSKQVTAKHILSSVNKTHEKKKKPTNKFPKQGTTNTTNQSNGTNINNLRKRNHKKDTIINNIDFNNVNIDKAEELIINAKKKKLNDAFKDEDQEDLLCGDKSPGNDKPKVKFDRKKEQIKKMLEKNNDRNSINMTGNSNSLRERMVAKLQAAQFRYLNEKLYTSSGGDAQQMFQADPAAFHTYHQGYQQQIKKWPVNPLDVIVKRIMKLPRTHSIADMGCGHAELARRVPHAARSFDVLAAAPGVEACDMARTPLPAHAVHVVVYCLALMGTQLADYLAEGNRVLKPGGLLLIAEVESRFESLEEFTRGVERLGFKLVRADRSHQVFYFLEFRKTQEASKKARHAPLTLKPCLYKRR